jgi:hypothetical protein
MTFSISSALLPGIKPCGGGWMDHGAVYACGKRKQLIWPEKNLAVQTFKYRN